MTDVLTTEKVFLFLMSLYPTFKATPETIAAYKLMLADIPPEKLQTAAMHAGGRSRFFPTVAELREAAFDLVEAGNGAVTASEAWGNVMNAVDRYGYYQADKAVAALPELEQRAVEATGGFARLCLDENGASIRARFIEAYQGIAQRARANDRMLPQVRASLPAPADRVSAPIKALLETKRL